MGEDKPRNLRKEYRTRVPEFFPTGMEIRFTGTFVDAEGHE